MSALSGTLAMYDSIIAHLVSYSCGYTLLRIATNVQSKDAFELVGIRRPGKLGYKAVRTERSRVVKVVVKRNGHLLASRDGDA